MTDASIISIEEYAAWPVAPGNERIAYGQNAQHFGDLYLPDGESPEHGWPTVILIHGGCWRSHRSLDPVSGLARAVAGEGVAVWSVEYRRLGSGGGWPNTFLDVGAAADYLSLLAQQYSLNLNRVIAVGHSAGGHLALWLASRTQLADDSPLYAETPQPLVGVVSLAGIPDLAEAATQEVCGTAPQELMGGLPGDVPSHYADGSPAERLPLTLPQILINGRQDRPVPLAYVKGYANQARSAGDPVELVVVENAGHFEIVAPASHGWPPVRDAIRTLLKMP